MRAWQLWLCIAVATLGGIFAFWYWGVSWQSIVMIALLLCCPAIMIWGMFKFRKSPEEELKNQFNRKGR